LEKGKEGKHASSHFQGGRREFGEGRRKGKESIFLSGRNNRPDKRKKGKNYPLHLYEGGIEGRISSGLTQVNLPRELTT